MSAPLRSILAEFGFKVDSSQLHKGHQAVEGFIGTLKQVGSIAAEAFIFHEVKEFVSQIVETASSLERMSVKTGVATDELQALEYAAKQSDISAESLGNSLGKLGKALYEAKSKGGESAKAFAEAGIAIKDSHGETRSAADALPDIADAFVRIKNPSERAALAMKFFGRSGVELIPLLAKGSAGIEELTAKAKELGGGLSEEAIAGAGKLEEATKDLDFAFLGLKSNLAAEVFPAIAQLVTWGTKAVGQIREWTKNTKLMQAATVGFAVKGVATLVGHLGGLRAILFRTLAPILLLEDFFVFMAGGKSVIGDVLEKAFGPGTSDKVRAGIGGILGALKEFVAQNPEVFAAVTALGVAFVGMGGPKAAENVNMLTKVLTGGSPFMVAVEAATAAVLALKLAWEQFVKLKGEMSLGSDFQQNVNAKRAAGMTDDQIPEFHTQNSSWLDSLPFVKGLKDKYGPGADIARQHDEATGPQRRGATVDANGRPVIESLPALPAAATATASLPPAVTTNATFNNNVENHISLPAGTDTQTARRVGNAASEGTLRAVDMAAAHAALVPGAG